MTENVLLRYNQNSNSTTYYDALNTMRVFSGDSKEVILSREFGSNLQHILSDKESITIFNNLVNKINIDNKNIFNASSLNENDNGEIRLNSQNIYILQGLLEIYADQPDYDRIFNDSGYFTERGYRAWKILECVLQGKTEQEWPHKPTKNSHEAEALIATMPSLKYSKADVALQKYCIGAPAGPCFKMDGSFTTKGLGGVLVKYWNDIYIPKISELEENYCGKELERDLSKYVSWSGFVEDSSLTDKGREALGYYSGNKEVVAPSYKKDTNRNIQLEVDAVIGLARKKTIENKDFTEEVENTIRSIPGYFQENQVFEKNISFIGDNDATYLFISQNEYYKDHKDKLNGVVSQQERENADKEAAEWKKKYDAEKNKKYNPNEEGAEKLRREDLMRAISGLSLLYKPTIKSDDPRILNYPARSLEEKVILRQMYETCDKVTDYDANILIGFLDVIPLFDIATNAHRMKLYSSFREQMGEFMTFEKMIDKDAFNMSFGRQLIISRREIFNLKGIVSGFGNSSSNVSGFSYIELSKIRSLYNGDIPEYVLNKINLEIEKDIGSILGGSNSPYNDYEITKYLVNLVPLRVLEWLGFSKSNSINEDNLKEGSMVLDYVDINKDFGDSFQEYDKVLGIKGKDNWQDFNPLTDKEYGKGYKDTNIKQTIIEGREEISQNDHGELINQYFSNVSFGAILGAIP